MNNDLIEKQGISFLNICLLRVGCLIPRITEDDKKPSWDGYIEVYKTDGLKKSNLLGKAPTQVKSTTIGNINSEMYYYQIQVVDLKNYLIEGGIIFFIIYLDKDGGHKIYYEKLTQLKIKRYLKNKENNKTISISLDIFPENNIDEIQTIFYQFIREHQTRVSDFILSLSDFEKNHPDGFDKFEMYYSGTGKKNPQEYFLSHQNTLYAVNTKAGIKIPIDIVKILSFDPIIQSPVTINKTLYYSSFKLTRTVDGIKLLFGASTTLFYRENKENPEKVFANLNCRLKGTLSQRINDERFFLNLLRNKTFSIEDHAFNFPDAEEEWNKLNPENTTFNMSSHLEHLICVQDTLRILGVEVENELNIDNMSYEDEEKMHFLISTVLNKNNYSLKDQSSQVIIQNIEISNLKILILLLSRDKKSYKVFNYFDKQLSASTKNHNNENIEVSPYNALKEDDLISVSNINFDIIYESFIKLPIDDDRIDMANSFVLTLLKAFDKSDSKNNNLIVLAQKLINFILDNSNNEKAIIYTLNKYQIIKRIRMLNDSELHEIECIASNSNKKDIKAGAYLILDDMVLAKRYFSEMSKQDQEDFKSYPIFHFMKENR